MEEGEPEASWVGFLITGTTLAQAVKQLCRSVLAGTPLQHFVDIGDSAFGVVDSVGCFSSQEEGSEGAFQLQGDHIPQPPWKRSSPECWRGESLC